jgi:hypothetical protein
VKGEARNSVYPYLGLLVPFGEAVGGQGVPPDEVPAEFPALLPDVEGEEVEGDPESEEPEPEAPVVPAVPGMVPHGEPLGVVPGAVVVFGFTVEGCVLLPGVAGFVELAPGTLEPAPGVAVPAGGVAVWAGGVAVPAGGVAERAGGVAVPAGGVAAPGACV